MFKLETQKFILFCCNKNHNLEHEVLSEVVVKMSRSNLIQTLKPDQSQGAISSGILKKKLYFVCNSMIVLGS